MYIYEYIHIYIYTYNIGGRCGFWPNGTQLTEILVPGGIWTDFGGRFMDKTALASPWGDGLQQAGSDAAMESFWRWTFVEIWLFFWYAIYRS